MNFDFEQMQTMLGQAKRQYDEIRRKVAAISVEGAAGGGMAVVVMNGDKLLLEVRLDPQVVKNDPDMLPDLIRAAVNDASRRIDERVKSELGAALFSGMPGMPPLPGLF